MVGFRLVKIIQIIVVVMLLISIFQVLQFNQPMVGNVSAGSSWVSTSQDDLNGTKNSVVVTLDGNVTLARQNLTIQNAALGDSDFIDKKNIDIANGDAKLIKFNKIFGGGNDDNGYSVDLTLDGGYIIAGETYSYGTGNGDVWLIKTDEGGNEVWNKSYGGSNWDGATSVQQVSDGGYILCGSTESYGGSDKDVWIVKTNESGYVQWDNVFGGNKNDYGREVLPTSDNGYIIVGQSLSFSSGSFDYDLWIIKTDENGTELWNKTFGKVWNDEKGFSIRPTSDGGFIIAGTNISGGESDILLIKITSSGNKVWEKSFGDGSTKNIGYSCQQTTDNEYIIVGSTKKSYGGGKFNIWLIKTDSSGNMVWNESFGKNWKDDMGYSVIQTNDTGYLITGHTSSFSQWIEDLWLIKTDSLGNEEWNKTYNDGIGNSVLSTYDEDYIICGNKTNGPSNDIWLIKTNETGCVEFPTGELTSTNLIAYEQVASIEEFHCEVIIPSGTGLKVQFSKDKVNWYNSTGNLDGWDVLSDGINDIILTQLDWSDSIFYYRIIFMADNEYSPVLKSISLSLKKYTPLGTLISKSYDAGANCNWNLIDWTNGDPSGMVEFQLRTGATSAELGTKDFVGPGGLKSANYTSPGEAIWTGHTGDRWVQWKAHFYTSNLSHTPVLEDVTVNYNIIPSAPTLLKPVPGNFTTDNIPTFNWTFSDPDSIQGAFQLVIDDNSDFSTIDYDSGVQSSPDPYWVFPIGTSYTDIGDGTWYWKVRTRDSDGDWGPFSPNWSLRIDTTPPLPFIPAATPSSWTNENGQIEITFATTDATSGIFQYDLTIKNSTYTNTYTDITSPYTLPAHPDGVYNITVNAFDQVNNVRAGWVDIYIDTNAPLEFTPIATPSGWTDNTQPEIKFMTTDELSGIRHYQIDIDHNDDFTNQTSPYTLPPQPDGIHNITARAIDLAGNSYQNFIDVYIDTMPPSSFTPTVDPSGWTNITQPEVSFTTTDATSGIDHYELKIDQEPFVIATSPFTLPEQTDGMYNITVRAFDKAGNYIDGNVIAHIDTQAPSITHTPVITGMEDAPITITATVKEVHSGIESVTLHYKKPTETAYAELTMIADDDYEDTYYAEIYPTVVTTDGLEYYIKASDSTTSPNIAYYGGSGWSTEQPTSLNDIDITITGNDTEAPTVLEKYPSGESVPIDTIITATFSETMNKTSAENAFSMSPNVDGTFTWTGNKLIFTPDELLDHNTEYMIRISTKAKDLIGNNIIADETWQFTTVSVVDKNRPRVIENRPTGTEASVTTDVEVGFNMAMNEQATQDAFVISPHVNGVFEWSATTLTFTPSNALEYNTQYNISITPEARSLDGYTMGEYKNWSFITEDEPVEKESDEFDWEVWEPIITILTILASLIAFLLGFLSIRRKRSKLRKYMEKIDNTYNEHQDDPEECEQELTGLRDEIKGVVKAGKIEENHFLILDKKIDDYIGEMKASKKGKGRYKSKGKRKPPRSKEEDEELEE